MATIQEEKIKLAAKEEMENILKERVKELIASGQPELAAQIIIEQARLELPDTHPSKGRHKLGVLEGEQISQLNEFEELASVAKDGTALLHALRAGQPVWEKNSSADEGLKNVRQSLNSWEATNKIIASVLLEHHQGIIPRLTRRILEIKREIGLIPSLPEGEVTLLEERDLDATENDSATE